jgi:lipopolysaccharide transport system permease protein
MTPAISASRAPDQMLRDLYRSFLSNRELVRELTSEELRRVNYGSVLGLLWLVMTPLLQAAVYIVVLGVIFPVRLGLDADPWSYARYVVSGFAIWHMITTALASAPLLFLSRVHLIRYVPYPLEMLPLPNAVVALLGGAVMLIMYLLLALLTKGLSFTILLLPIPLTILAAFLIGATWLLMITGVFFRDTPEILRIVFMILIYPSPILFTEAMLGPYWPLVLINPFSHFVISFRDVLYGTWHPLSWTVFIALSMAALFAGAWAMHTARRTLQNFV